MVFCGKIITFIEGTLCSDLRGAGEEAFENLKALFLINL
jgi:hypothetical protein